MTRTYTPQEMILNNFFHKNSQPGDIVCMLRDRVFLIWHGKPAQYRIKGE
jgi:hypothetical protein